MYSVFSPDIVCIVESWLDDTISDNEIFVQGYSIVRLDHSRHGVGVLIYVKDLFTCSPLFKGRPLFECLIVTINSSPGSSPDFTVALFYRPPSSSPALLDTLFFALCNNFVSSSPSFFLVGDFNIDFLVPSTSLYFKLLSVVSSFNLSQIVSEPTRVSNSSSTLIDLIFVSSIVSVESCVTVPPPLANADHFGLQLVFTIPHIPNVAKSHLQGEFGNIPLRISIVLPNY